MARLQVLYFLFFTINFDSGLYGWMPIVREHKREALTWHYIKSDSYSGAGLQCEWQAISSLIWWPYLKVGWQNRVLQTRCTHRHCLPFFFTTAASQRGKKERGSFSTKFCSVTSSLVGMVSIEEC